MKKQYLKTMAIMFATTLLFLTGCGANNMTDNNTGNNGAGNIGSNTAGNNNGTEQTNKLTEADARQITLKKAGLETATFTKQEYDANESKFEFEFHTDAKEYECDVNAIDGSIHNYSVENMENKEIFD